MTTPKKYSFSQSLGLAFSGICRVVKRERNIKIHILIALVVMTLGLVFDISRNEWFVLLLIIFAILAAEIFNSAIEEVCNLASSKMKLEYHETKFPRDISAGAVLILVLAAIIIGLVIFLPRILALLR